MKTKDKSNSLLTQQAFTINMELGMLVQGGTMRERVDPIFYSDPMTTAMKALGMT